MLLFLFPLDAPVAADSYTSFSMSRPTLLDMRRVMLRLFMLHSSKIKKLASCTVQSSGSTAPFFEHLFAALITFACIELIYTYVLFNRKNIGANTALVRTIALSHIGVCVVP